MHFPAADAGAPCAFRIGAVAVELAAKAGVFQDVPGDERHRQHHRHRQVEHGGVVQFAKGDAVADPVRQAVDAFAVFGEVDEQAEEEVEGGDGDDDGDDAEAVYQHGVEDAERRAAQAGKCHAAQPAAAAVFHQHADGDVLHDRRGNGEGDVDAADDEDDDEAGRKNHLHRVLVEQVKEILPAEEAGRGEGEAGGEQEDEQQQDALDATDVFSHKPPPPVLFPWFRAVRRFAPACRFSSPARGRTGNRLRRLRRR